MEATAAVMWGLFAGGLGGFVLSMLGWLETGTKFNARKNVAGVLTATVTGLLTTVALVQTSIFTDPTTPDWQLIVAYITIFGAAAGFGSMGRKAAGAANAPETTEAAKK
jgi:hypothetical protein